MIAWSDSFRQCLFIIGFYERRAIRQNTTKLLDAPYVLRKELLAIVFRYARIDS